MTTAFTDDAPPVLWSPPADARTDTRLGRYLDWLERTRGLELPDYDTAWRWSVEHPGAFWRSIVEHLELVVHQPPSADLVDASMPGARWFPGMALNYAENALARLGDDDEVVVARSQTREASALTGAELRRQVAACAAGLAELGVGRGDRVAAYLPNIPEALVAFLATASLGAIWSSCAPEFGTRSVVDRLTQIDPTVLLTIEGYAYGDKRIERHEEVASIRSALPSLDHVVHVPYLPGAAPIPDSRRWADLLDRDAELAFEPVAFDHPLYVLYSSGTTGLPKPITHGHGGIVLEHAKAIALHGDLGPGDRFFWFSTTGWMMWNFLVSGLLVGATIVLFDGDPASPDLDALWRLAEETGTTYFGVSAPFLMACRKQGLRPRDAHDLTRLRGIGSTGAPLPPEGFDWVYDAVTDDALLGSISGGTDVCTAFVGPAPLVEVRSGEIPCRYLGAKVEAFDEHGEPVIGDQGELVITAPMPSMPVGFWGDEDGSRYREAYFDVYPGVWRHGDWITITERGSCVITGRSDATLNRGGVRLGTAEFYSVVEALDEVADSLVVHLEDPTGEGLGELRLFVVPAAGTSLDEEALASIRTRLRAELSPRHVPDRIDVVDAIPRTLSGKRCEVPVKRILRGADPDRAVSRGALANPDAIAAFERFAAERTGSTPR